MMYELSENMKNEIRNQLDKVCADSTNILISKYELFTAARDVVGDHVRYHAVRKEVEDIIGRYLVEHKYPYLIKWNGKYNEYYITTEEVSATVESKSRNRITIPANIVRTAGLEPGDLAMFDVYFNEDLLKNCYIFSKFEHEHGRIENGYRWVAERYYTVDKDNAIRMTVDSNNAELTATAGEIKVYLTD